MLRMVTHLIEHSSAMDVALMRQNLGNIFFQQLARGHEQLPNRTFGRWGLVALYGRRQADPATFVG